MAFSGRQLLQPVVPTVVALMHTIAQALMCLGGGQTDPSSIQIWRVRTRARLALARARNAHDSSSTGMALRE